MIKSVSMEHFEMAEIGGLGLIFVCEYLETNYQSFKFG